MFWLILARVRFLLVGAWNYGFVSKVMSFALGARILAPFTDLKDYKINYMRLLNVYV